MLSREEYEERRRHVDQQNEAAIKRLEAERLTQNELPANSRNHHRKSR